MDNATYHHHWKVVRLINILQLPVMYAAPYAAPLQAIELIFSMTKRGNLNPMNLRTNKAHIQNTIDLIRKSLERCIGAFTVRAFAHTVIHAFKAYTMSEYGWDQE